MHIPNSFMGYKKEVVDEIINQKNCLLGTQQQDIDYLRKEITRLERRIKEQDIELEKHNKTTLQK